MLSKFEVFTSAISEINQYIHKLERDEMIKYGCKGAFAQYLAAMNRYPDGVTSVELCEICDKDKAAVSRIVSEMEEKGLVVRERENDCLYRARIKLTDSGKEAAEYVLERASVAVAEAGIGLSDEDRRVFYSTLELIASNLHKLSEEGIPEK